MSGFTSKYCAANGAPTAAFLAARADHAPAEREWRTYLADPAATHRSVLDEIRKASDAMSAGAVHETVIVLARFTLIFRSVDAETFLVLILAPDGNLGKARYLMRKQLYAIRQEL